MNDQLLNCVALVFLQKIDDEIASWTSLRVDRGIAKGSDGGKKVLESYLLSGVRKQKNPLIILEKIMCRIMPANQWAWLVTILFGIFMFTCG